MESFMNNDERAAIHSDLLKRNGTERIIWTGSSSVIIKLKSYLFLLGIAAILIVFASEGYVQLGVFALIFILRALYLFFSILCTKYTITTQRLKIRSGIFSKTTKEIELYRVKDIDLYEPLFLRIFKLGSIRLLTSQIGSGVIKLKGLRHGAELREQLRLCVEVRRMDKGVAEVDARV